MQLILIIVGAFVGGWIADIDEELLGFAAGGFVGYLLAQLSKVKKEQARLIAQVDSLGIKIKKMSAPEVAPPVPRPTPARPAESQPDTESAVPLAAVQRKTETPARIIAEPREATSISASALSRQSRTLDKLFKMARDWITTGNVPVKVGVIISFFGVAFLLKYAVDNQILSIPIELRLVAVAVGALVMLGIGWRLREKRPTYALSLQGGGIGILYLTIFAAFRLYDLLPATAAFALLVVLTIATGVLSVVQNARALSIFAIVGGFLAPVLTSTGSGNHVALFSYYLLLNAAILGISWFRAWRGLNLLGFAFTFGIGTAWGYQYYRPDLYASTQPFLILYFLFYQAIAVLFAFRQKPDLRGLVDGTILFGTPVISFGLQSRIVSDTEYGLAISAVVLASFYVLLAAWLFQRHRSQLKLMTESYVALGIAFATIAIPLALDARWTAVAWSLEGAALVWVGVRQSGLLARASGAVLLFAGGVAFIDGGWKPDAGIPILNGNALGGFLISAASLFGANRLRRDPAPIKGQFVVSILLMLWGLWWWFMTGGHEVDNQVPQGKQLDSFLLFSAASTAAFAMLARKLDWRSASMATLAYLPMVFLIALIYLFEHSHWFRGLGWIAWPVTAAAHVYLLRLYDRGNTQHEGLWHFVGVLLFTCGVAFDLAWRLNDADLAYAWSQSAGIAVLALVSWAILAWRNRWAWPLQRYNNSFFYAAGTLTFLSLYLLASAGIENPGTPDPLPYVPLLNPYDLVTGVTLVIALRCLQLMQVSIDGLTPKQIKSAQVLWIIAAFVLTTIAVVRGVYHYADVQWYTFALRQSVSVQAALSIYWAILGFGGMIYGARRTQRTVWLMGAGMMGVVVAKLFLVDLGNTGTVARIVSFLGVGVLLLIVGYFAPAPPRSDAAKITSEPT